MAQQEKISQVTAVLITLPLRKRVVKSSNVGSSIINQPSRLDKTGPHFNDECLP
jgi:hypothetical protein